MAGEQLSILEKLGTEEAEKVDLETWAEFQLLPINVYIVSIEPRQFDRPALLCTAWAWGWTQRREDRRQVVVIITGICSVFGWTVKNNLFVTLDAN